jgi:orotate phosphoribosyltransferase
MIDHNHKYLIAQAFLACEAVKVAEPGQAFRLRSGRSSDYYVDCRKVTLSSKGAALLGEGFVQELRKIIIDLHYGPPLAGPILCLGATGVGGQALLGATLAVAGQSGLPLCGFVDRGLTKAHGLLQRFEGQLRPDLPVVLLDDILTTGGTLVELTSALKAELQVEPVAALYAVDREEGGAERLADCNLKARAMLTAAELLELAGLRKSP